MAQLGSFLVLAGAILLVLGIYYWWSQRLQDSTGAPQKPMMFAYVVKWSGPLYLATGGVMVVAGIIVWVVARA